MRNELLRAWLLVLLCLPGLALAHGLLLDAEHRDGQIVGTVYYSNGDLAVRQAVELLDLSEPSAAPIAGETDDSGRFRFSVAAEHRYRISAYGDEGHDVSIELSAAANERPKLLDDAAAADEQSWLPPAWAVIGVFLLVSLVPAVLSRRRPAQS